MLAKRLAVCLLLFAALGSLSTLHAAEPTPVPKQRPNIIILFADDQRADTLGAWGNEQIQTPNIDQLAQAGCSFKSNYCFGSNSGAVCVPSRAMLHTGRNWLHVKHDMSNAPVMGELLQKQGYQTFGTGKWHNGEASFLRSFHQGEAVFFGGMCDHTKVPIKDAEDGKTVRPRTGKKVSSELFADAAVNFLKNYQGNEPFFCYVAFTAPHDPRQPPEAEAAIYQSNPPELPANFLPQHPFNNGSLTIRDEQLAPWPRPEAMIREQLGEYYGLITHLDQQIGRILETVKNSRHAEDTYIIYAADHGLAMGSHGLLGKQSVYEHSMRCPLIIAGPGVPKGSSTEAFTYLYDLLPTICQLTGAKPPADLDGHSLLSVAKGERESVRDSVFLPYSGSMRSVRDERWKLIKYPAINHTQLFDLQQDPHELKNLAEAKEHREEVERLTKLMLKWQAEVGDKQPLESASPKPKEIDLTGHARTPDRWQPEWIVKKYFED